VNPVNVAYIITFTSRDTATARFVSPTFASYDNQRLK